MRKKVSMENIFRKRRIALMYIVTILFGILFVRTFQVMILDQKKYSELLSSLNYSTVYGDSTPRGRILDRNGKVIVDNKAVNTIVFKKENGTSMSEMIELHMQLVHI